MELQLPEGYDCIFLLHKTDRGRSEARRVNSLPRATRVTNAGLQVKVSNSLYAPRSCTEMSVNQ